MDVPDRLAGCARSIPLSEVAVYHSFRQLIEFRAQEQPQMFGCLIAGIPGEHTGATHISSDDQPTALESLELLVHRAGRYIECPRDLMSVRLPVILQEQHDLTGNPTSKNDIYTGTDVHTALWSFPKNREIVIDWRIYVSS